MQIRCRNISYLLFSVWRSETKNMTISGLSVGRDSNQLSQSSSTSQIPLYVAAHSSNSTTTTTSSSVTSSTSSTSKMDAEELRSKSATPRTEFEDYQPPASNVALQEPDVIASTKLAHSKTTDSIITNKPVPPPRLKRKPTRDRIDVSKAISSSQESIPVAVVAAAAAQLKRSDSGSQLQLIMADVPPQSGRGLVPPPPPSDESVLFPSPNTLESITRELESSFAKVAPVTTIDGGGPLKNATISRVSYSLGNSTSSVNNAAAAPPGQRPSPSNSAKSNSAPARVSAIDPSEGLDIFKATYGKYVVKPQDGDYNKAEGPSQVEMERIRAELYDNNPLARTQFASTGSNSLGNGPR